MKPLSKAIAFSAGIAALFAVWQMAGLRQEALSPTVQEETTGTVPIGGEFTLIDSSGNIRRSSDFSGKYLLVYFGYTFCPDVCPTDLTKLSKVMQGLGDVAGEVVPIFITVDPARDTVEQLAGYKNAFDPRIVMLTGSDEAIASAAAAYRVYYAKVPEEGDNTGEGDHYLVDHSAFTYMMGRDGKYLRHFGHEATAEEIIAAMKETLQAEKTSAEE